MQNKILPKIIHGFPFFDVVSSYTAVVQYIQLVEHSRHGLISTLAGNSIIVTGWM